MSKVVDERVVQMQFDNAQFEKGVQTSMSSIEKLKKGLRFDGATKGLESIESAAKKVNFNPIGSAVQSLGQKFSALEVMGVTALVNITNSAVNAGKKMVEALTIKPVMSGFEEYQTQINAIQTILANTSHAGTTLEEVNSALDQLNKYADMTIYNFTQMTRNIGTFTAAGVDLKTSVSAIKGIANLAAVSGSTAQQASTAMYQLSQAIAAGRVSLQDWNSVVNAGMGGKVFQDALMNTAEVMGVVVDRSQSFRESIEGGDSWLTTDILLNTLKQFTGDMTNAELAAIGFKDSQIEAIQAMAVTANDAATKVKTFTQLWDTLQEAAQSGWTQTWELIIGDFDQAKALLTEISDVVSGIINESAESRNSLLEGALTGSSGKWEDLTEKINEAGVSTEQFESRLREVILASGVTEGELDDLIEKNGSLSAVFQKGLLPIKLVVTAIKSFAEEVTTVTKPVKVATTNLEKFNDVVTKVIRGDFGNGAARIDALTKAGYDNVAVQKLVNLVWERNGHNWSNVTVTAEELTKVIGDLSTEEIQSVGYTEEQANALKELAKQAEETGTPLNDLIESFNRPSGRDLIIDSFRTVLTSLYKVIMSVKEAWTNIFPPMTSNQLYGIIEAVHTFTQRLAVNEDTLDKLTRTFQGLFAILDLISTFLGGGFKLAIQAVNVVLGLFGTNILDLSAKLGDAVVAFRNFVKDNNVITKFFSSIVSSIPSAIEAVKNWIRAISEIPVVKDLIDKVTNSLQNLKDIAPNVIAGLQNGLKEGITALPQIMMDIGRSMVDAIKKVLGIHSPSTVFKEIAQNIIEGIIEGLIEFSKKLIPTMMEIGGNIVRGFIDGTKTLIPDMAYIAKDIVTTVIDIFKDVDFSALVNAIMGAGILFVFNRITKTIDNFTKAISSFAAPLKGLQSVFNSVSNFINTKTKEMKTQNFKTFAEAIAILAGSITVLALIPWQKALTAAGIIAGLTVVLGGIAVAIGKWGPKEAMNLNSFALSLVAIGASLLIAAGAMQKLASIDPSMWWKVIAMFITATGGISALVLSFAKLEKMGAGNAIGKFTAMIGRLVGAITAMILVTKLMRILNVEDAKHATAFMGGFLGTLTILMLIAKINAKNVTKVTALMTTLGVAVGAMALAVKLIGTLSNQDLAQGAKFMTGFLAMLALIQAIGIIPSKGIENVGKTVLSIAGAIGIIALVVKMLENVSGGAIAKGTVAIVAFGGIVELLIISVSKFEKDAPKVGATLLAASAAIGILAGIAVLLGGVKTENLVKGTLAVSALGVIMALMIKSLKGAQEANKSVVAMSVGIGVMAAAIGILSFIDPADLMGPTIAMGVLMGMFALIIKASKDIKASVGVLAVLTVAVGLMAGALYLLNDLDSETMLATATALSGVMLAMSVALKIVASIDSITKEAIIALGVMTLAVAGIAAVLWALDELNVEPSIETAKSISLLLAAMTGATLALTLIGKLGGVAGAANGALALDAVIGIVGGLMVGLGALMEYVPQLEVFLDKGLTVLQKVGEGIGSFIGGIAGNFMAGIGSGLLEMGNSLSSFMTNLSPFIENSKSIDASSVDGIGALVKMILALTAADLINGLSSFLGLGTGMPLATFAEQLVPFGEAMAEFGSTIQGKIDPETTNAAANAGMMIAELNKSLPKEGGALQSFLGTNMSLEDFSAGITAFGEAIVAFSEVVAPGGTSVVNQEAVDAAANAGMTIAELNKNLPRQGGALQDFFGSQDLAAFSEDMVAFGEAIVAFSDVVAPGGVLAVNQEAVAAAANAGMLLSKLNASIPKTGGALQDFLGQQDLKAFSANIIVFGRCIAQFSKVIAPNGTSLINSEAVSAAANAGMLLAELNNAIPSSGGVAQWFTGKKDFKGFSDQLVAFGEAMADYSKSIEGIKPVSITSSVTAAKDLVNLVQSLEDESIFKGWFTKETDVSSLFSGLTTFGADLSVYSNQVSGIKITPIKNSAEAAKSLIGMMNSIASTGLFENKLSLGDFAAGLVPLGQNLAVYSDFAKTIEPVSIDASVVAAKALTSLVGALGNNAYYINATTLGDFAANLIPLGENLSVYADFVRGLDVVGVQASAAAAKSIASIGEILSGTVVGDTTSLSKLTKDLVPFGENLAVYSAFAKEISSTAVDVSVVAGKSLASLIKSLSETNVGQSIDLGNFGTSLITFGRSLSVYSDFVRDVDVTVIKTTADAAGYIISAFFSGNRGEFIGTKDLENFCKNLITLGQNLAVYSDYVLTVDSGGIERSAAALRDLLDITGSFGSKGGLFQGDAVTAQDFGNSIVSMGSSLAVYSDFVSTIDTASVNVSIGIAKRLLELPEFVDGGLFNKNTLSNFGNELKLFGEGMKNFYATTSDINSSSIDAIIANVQALADMGSSFKGIDLSGFENLTKNLKDSANKGIDYFVKAFEGAHGRASTAVNDFISSTVQSVNTKDPEFTTAVDKMVQNGLNAINSKEPEFKKVGLKFVQSLIDGLNDTNKQNDLKGKARTLATSAVAAVKEELGISGGSSSVFKEIGGYISESLAVGMEEKAQKTKNSAKKVANMIEETVRDETDVHSLSDIFIGIGGYVTESLGVGLESTLGFLRDSAVSVSQNGILDTVENILLGGAGEEIGDGLMIDVSKGIKKNMSAEEVAQKKAENIGNAFKTALEELDLAASIRDLEFSLSAEDAKSDFDAYQKELQYMEQKQADQVIRVSLAQAKYEKMVETFGETSKNALEAYKELLEQQVELSNQEKEIAQLTTDYEESQLQKRRDLYDQKSSIFELEYELTKSQNERTASQGQKVMAEVEHMREQQRQLQEELKEAEATYGALVRQYGSGAAETYEAYANVLQLRIDYTNLGNDITKAMEDEMERNTKAFEKYKEYLKENKGKLRAKGWTTEEIEAEAMKETGYDPTSLIKKMDKDARQATVAAMKNVQTTYKANAAATFEPLVMEFDGYGQKYATAVGTGITAKAPEVTETAKKMVTDGETVIKAEYDNWTSAGSYLVSGFVKGIKDNIQRAANAAAEMAREAYEAAMEELEEHSPSRKFMRVGMYVDLGFAKGVRDYTHEATSATSDMAVEAFDAMSEIVSAISDTIDSDMDVEPTIRPVLDLSEVKTGAKTLNSMFNYDQALTIGASLSKAQIPEGQNGAEQTTPTSVQFVQNNYSPKALSRIDIYRDTKNQVASLERLMKR